MTVIEPPTPNGYVADLPDPPESKRYGSLLLLKDGRCRIEQIDGTVSTIRRPSYGEYQRLKLSFEETQRDYLARLATVKALPAPPEDFQGDDPRVKALHAATDDATDQVILWWLDLNRTMISPPLPDDVEEPLQEPIVQVLDDPANLERQRLTRPASPKERVDRWPADLIDGYLVQVRLINHWTHVPSDRGSADRPAPTVTI